MIISVYFGPPKIMQSSTTGCLAMVVDMLGRANVGWWNNNGERRAVVVSGEFLTRVIMKGVL